MRFSVVGRGRAVFGAILLATLVAGACSNETPAAAPPGSAGPVIVAGDAPREGQVVAGGGTTVVVEPPVTFPVGDPTAVQVFEGLSTRLPMTEAERACATAKLAGDSGLLERVQDGVSPNTPDFDALANVMMKCRQETTFSDQFVAGFEGSITEEQAKCLHDGFGALSADDLDAVLGAALQAPGSLVARGPAVAEKLFGGCGVTR